MATVNEKILSKSIKHQVEIQVYSNGVVKRMIAVLNRVESDLMTKLSTQLDKMPQSSFNVDRLDKLLSSVNDLNDEAYTIVTKELNNELQDLVAYEAGFQKQLFANTIPLELSFATVNAEQVYSAAMARPFQGKLLKEWMSGLEADKAIRIRDAVRIGYVANESIPQIVKRIRGTKALNYKDGILEITRRNAETIARSAVGHTAAFTRERFFDANAEVIKELKWSATLDSKTSEPCRLRDGKRYTQGTHKPIGHSLPWGGGAGAYHLNCRSSAVAVTKSWRELGFDMDELPEGTRASMSGQVPADVTYGNWLKGQSANFQDDVLGKTKGKLFRDGGLSIENFANNKGKSFTLDELRIRDASAFKQAGID